jgi:mannose-6-phosphate isomerase-like protein (cupin superfamily)
MVVEGTARIEAGGDVVDAGPGTLLTLEPGERHSVASDGGARIVMILSSWPAEGQYPAWPGDDVPKARGGAAAFHALCDAGHKSPLLASGIAT